MMGETKQSICAEERVETLTISSGNIFHKAVRLYSILNEIENKINGELPEGESKFSEPNGIKSYVYFSNRELDNSISLAERIKDIL